MDVQHTDFAAIGFGEAGQALIGPLGARVRVYDVKVADSLVRPIMFEQFRNFGVQGCETVGEALSGARTIFSLVTADAALSVAKEAARLIAPGALFCDMNSVAPETKREAAFAISQAGGHYVDVAIMAPVLPARLTAPILTSGAHAKVAVGRLTELGFADAQVAGTEVGRASTIKMIRSAMVKGMEALTAECMLAAHAAGVLTEVIGSLEASETASSWANRADYNLDRMMVHGLRRAAETEEVVRTLEDLGTGASMTRGTVVRQKAIGVLGLSHPHEGLLAKIEQIEAMGMQNQ